MAIPRQDERAEIRVHSSDVNRSCGLTRGATAMERSSHIQLGADRMTRRHILEPPMRRLIPALVMAATCAAVALPATAASFDCRKARTVDEKAICAERSL